jgi:hypothetical protein
MWPSRGPMRPSKAATPDLADGMLRRPQKLLLLLCARVGVAQLLGETLRCAGLRSRTDTPACARRGVCSVRKLVRVCVRAGEMFVCVCERASERA